MTTLPTLCIMGKLDWSKQNSGTERIFTPLNHLEPFQVDLMSLFELSLIHLVLLTSKVSTAAKQSYLQWGLT